MTWVVTPGSRIPCEIKVVNVAASTTREELEDVFTMTYRLLDRAGASVATGDAEREAEGVYLCQPLMPANATKGHTYALEVTITPTLGDNPDILLIPILVGGPAS